MVLAPIKVKSRVYFNKPARMFYALIAVLREREQISSLWMCRISADSNQRLIVPNLAAALAPRCGIGAAAAQAWPHICSRLLYSQFVFSFKRHFSLQVFESHLPHSPQHSQTTRHIEQLPEIKCHTFMSGWRRADWWVLCDISEVAFIEFPQTRPLGWLDSN